MARMTTEVPTSSRPRVPALAIALVAIFMGCIVDALVKHLGGRYGAILIACCRYGFGAVFAVIAFVAARRPMPSLGTLRAHVLRSCASTSSAVLFFHALTVLQLAEATVLIFCAPLLIAPLARLILGERFRLMALLAIGLGFAGVMVTVIGAPAAANPRHLEGVIAGLCAALLYSLSIVLLRQLAQRNEALTSAMLGNVFPFLFLIGPVLWLGQAPLVADLPVLAALGLIGFTLWFLLTRAYSRAPAQSLAISEYSALIWSAALGFVVFHETPGWQVWAGAAIICVAIGLSAWDSQRIARRGAAETMAAGPGVLPG